MDIPGARVARATAFYGALFGWEFEDVRDDYAHVKGSYPAMGLKKGEAAQYADLYFRVDDIGAVADKLGPLGGKAGAIAGSPSGRYCRCEDDQGAVFSLWQLANGY